MSTVRLTLNTKDQSNKRRVYGLSTLSSPSLNHSSLRLFTFIYGSPYNTNSTLLRLRVERNDRLVGNGTYDDPVGDYVYKTQTRGVMSSGTMCTDNSVNFTPTTSTPYLTN